MSATWQSDQLPPGPGKLGARDWFRVIRRGLPLGIVVFGRHLERLARFGVGLAVSAVRVDHRLELGVPGGHFAVALLVCEDIRIAEQSDDLLELLGGGCQSRCKAFIHRSRRRRRTRRRAQPQPRVPAV